MTSYFVQVPSGFTTYVTLVVEAGYEDGFEVNEDSFVSLAWLPIPESSPRLLTTFISLSPGTFMSLPHLQPIINHNFQLNAVIN